MQQQSSDILERILEVGKQEFLANGFKGASLRKIAALAGVTTGTIYSFFPDKEALFCALVEEPATHVLESFLQTQREFDAQPAGTKADSIPIQSRKYLLDILNYVYDNLDAFKLILTCSAGTKYAGYLDKLVEIEERYTDWFLETLRQSGQNRPEISPVVVHILCSASYTGIFEVVAHDIPREEALAHIEALNEFFRAGWSRLMGVNWLSDK